MAEATFEDVATWLRDNPDKEGTPDYVHMAGAYRSLHPDRVAKPSTAQPKGMLDDIWARAKQAFNNEPAPRTPEEQPDVPDIEDLMAAQRLTSDPRSLSNRGSRILAGTLGGATDVGIGGFNAAARAVGSPESQYEYVTPKMLENAGTPDLPPDASWYERGGEGLASAFFGGGAGAATGPLRVAQATAAATKTAVPIAKTAARMAVPTVIPTVTGEVGGEAGAWLGRNYLGDEETGRYLGSLAGGSALTAKPAAQSIIHQLYAGKGRLDAPQILAAANRQGVTPTAGMLGNDSILQREQRLSGMPGSAEVVNDARTTARTQIGEAYDASAAARGSTNANPTPGSIGDQINTAARESAEALRAHSDARQTALNDRIPQDTPTHIGPIQERGYNMMTDPNARIGPTERASIDYRITDQLNPLASRNAGGQPIMEPVNPPGPGHNGGPPMGPMTQVAPYGDVAGFSTELGRSIDTPAGGRHPPATALYEPTRTVMREAAGRAGVDPRDFNNTQNATRDITRETPTTPGGLPGDYHALLDLVRENPEAAFNNLNNRGRQDPNVSGLLDATGHYSLGNLFGNLMRFIGNETINSPQGGARGPANFANAWHSMDEGPRATILGDQLPHVSDQTLLATRLNVPTSQAGLTRAVGGQGDAVANKVLGSEAMGRLGEHYLGPLGGLLGRVIGMLTPAEIRGRRASILEGPTARNALARGDAPNGINELAAALTAAQANQQQNRPGAP